MTKRQFIDCAIRAGLVPSAAVDDAESYDGCATLHQLSVMWTAVCELKQDEPRDHVRHYNNPMWRSGLTQTENVIAGLRDLAKSADIPWLATAADEMEKLSKPHEPTADGRCQQTLSKRCTLPDGHEGQHSIFKGMVTWDVTESRQAEPTAPLQEALDYVLQNCIIVTSGSFAQRREAPSFGYGGWNAPLDFPPHLQSTLDEALKRAVNRGAKS